MKKLNWLITNFLVAVDYDNKIDYYDADKILYAWDYLYSIMLRENRFDGNLGNELIDWQIGNWAGDTDMVLWNSKRYTDVIALNEQILSIGWNEHVEKDGTNLFHENAKRQIADAYEAMGNSDKCFELYNKYLKEDPNWGWGWIGYFRHLHKYDKNKFKDILISLYDRIFNGDNFHDKKDLYRELSDEFNNVGMNEYSSVMKKMYDDVTIHKYDEIDKEILQKTISNTLTSSNLLRKLDVMILVHVVVGKNIKNVEGKQNNIN